MNIPAAGRWTFETSAVAQAFDQHVREQLPWYELVTGGVAHLARHYIPKGGLVIDVGASTGNVGRAIAPVLEDRQARIIPIEASAEMASRYVGPGADAIVVQDALTFDYPQADLIVCFLVLMFLPVAERAAYIAHLRSCLRPGGALVIVDKTEATSGYAATALWRLTLAGKVAAGVPGDEIVAKELSLGGVQRPIDPARELGPDFIEWFRFGDFAGWLVETS